MNDFEMATIAQSIRYDFDGQHLRKPVYIEFADCYLGSGWPRDIYCGTNVVAIANNVINSAYRVYKCKPRRTVHFFAYLANKDGEPMGNAKPYHFGATMHETVTGELYIKICSDPAQSVHNKTIRDLLGYLRDVSNHRNEQICAKAIRAQNA